MSYDISLNDRYTGEPLLLDCEHHMRGGNYVVGGTREAHLNITYNYGEWYRRDGVFPKEGKKPLGIRAIYGLTGAESISVLKCAILALEAMDEDISDERRRECEANGATGYWMPTRLNALRPLTQLLALAQMRPDGVWGGD